MQNVTNTYKLQILYIYIYVYILKCICTVVYIVYYENNTKRADQYFCCTVDGAPPQDYSYLPRF